MSAPAGQEGILAVQEHDTRLDQLRHRRATLEERTTLERLRAELAALDAEVAAATSERAVLEERRTALDREVADIADRVASLDRRLVSGEVTATRELTAMVEQRDALRRRRGELEDAELELMIGEEPLDEQLAGLEPKVDDLRARIAEAEQALRAAEEAVDEELGAEEAARSAAAAEVDASLLATYERLRQRLGGVGAARLVGPSCSGCHLTLPATELDRVRRLPADELVTCDQCGRILVR